MVLFLATVSSAGLSAQKREFDNRFEGAFIKDGNPQFKLTGVLRAPVDFTPQVSIWVKFFLPPGKSPDSGVQIEAQELVDLHAYFMQSKSFAVTAGAWNRFGPWPAGDVLVPQEIEAANLSVTASYVDDTGTRVYLRSLRGETAFRLQTPTHSNLGLHRTFILCRKP
jgi:hypothetical protein